MKRLEPARRTLPFCGVGNSLTSTARPATPRVLPRGIHTHAVTFAIPSASGSSLVQTRRWASTRARAAAALSSSSSPSSAPSSSSSSAGPAASKRKGGSAAKSAKQATKSALSSGGGVKLSSALDGLTDALLDADLADLGATAPAQRTLLSTAGGDHHTHHHADVSGVDMTYEDDEDGEAADDAASPRGDTSGATRHLFTRAISAGGASEGYLVNPLDLLLEAEGREDGDAMDPSSDGAAAAAAGSAHSAAARAGQAALELAELEDSLVMDPFTPSIDQEGAAASLHDVGLVPGHSDTSAEGQLPAHGVQRGSAAAARLMSASSSSSSSAAGAKGSSDANVLSVVDMLCDDLYYCKTSVLRSFSRTRGITGRTKAEVVLRLLECADRDAHGESTDLSLTKRVLGDVFHEEVRTSGMRAAWNNKALEASHIEMACDRHLRFELMANTQKTMMVRRNAGEAARVLRKLSRPFQQEYDKFAAHAVGNVFRTYKAEADALVQDLSVAEVVSPFASVLVSYVRYGSSINLLTRTDVNSRLVQMEVVQPLVENSDMQTLQDLMTLLDPIVSAVEQRAVCFGEKKTQWGQDSAEVLVAAAQSFSEVSHGSWGTERAPQWVHELARMFTNWEVIVRGDVGSLSDVPRVFFDCILCGVVNYYVLKEVYGAFIEPKDIPMSVRASLKKALTRHFNDEEKAANVLSDLISYVMSGEGVNTSEARGGVRGEFFVSVLSQMQGAYHEGDHTTLHAERVAVVLNEVAMTASRCTRSSGLFHMLVRMTEDLAFHFRFQRVFKRLSANDRKTIRTKQSLNLLKTLDYFEKELEMSPLTIKSVAFLTIQLLFLSMRSDDGRRPVVERFRSVLGRAEFGIVGLSEVEATQVRDLRIAFPPQLSYNSWLNESDTKEKSVYNVLPSVAVKGATNQAMIISQAPMMKALDAISRVPWRINKYMLHVQEAIVREGFGFGKIRPGFYPLHYCSLSPGDIRHGHSGGGDISLPEDLDDADLLDLNGGSTNVFNLAERRQYDHQLQEDWKELSELRSSRIHYLQALRQARSIVRFSHIYFPNSMDFRGRMYPLPGRLNHTGSDPFRGLLEYAEPKPLGTVGLYWLKVHLANKMGMTKLSFDERVHYVDEHIEDVVQSAESPLHGDRWWQEASEPMQCLMACKELADALKHSQGPETFLSRLPVAVDGSYNGLQHYSAIGRDSFGATLVNLVPSDRPADAYTGILKEMMKSIEADAGRDHQVAQRCLGTGKGQDKNHIKRKTIKRPIMTQVYGVTGYGMSEQILDELVKQNKSHGLWTNTDMKEMSAYLREKVLESLGVTFKETQNCRKWLSDITEQIWAVQPAELRNALCWTTPLGLVVRQPYKVHKECSFFSPHGYTKVPGDAVAPASRKQLTAIAPNLIHSLDATHLAMTALEMQHQGLSMMAVHDSYWTYACDLPQLSKILREQFVVLYSQYDPLWELKEQWEECYFADLRRHGVKLPDPPKRGDLDLKVVLDSPYFFS